MTGGVLITDGAQTICAASYGGWFMQTAPGGKSIQLKDLSFAGSATAAGWCLSANTFATGADFGTPGAKSDCP
jgi:hypothetical protein